MKGVLQNMFLNKLLIQKPFGEFGDDFLKNLENLQSPFRGLG